MPETSLIPIETKKKIEEAIEFFHTLKEVKFTNDQEYEHGVELCRSIKQHINSIDTDRKALVKPYNEKLYEINGECNGVIRQLQNGENVIKKGMGAYYQEKERKRLEDQRRLEAEAEERRRQEEERARREAEKEAKYREEGRDKLADQAAARKETAENIASNIVAPIVENTAKVSGTTFTKKYKIEVINRKKAVEAMVMNDILFQYVLLDEKGIERLINTQKGKINIDGIRIYEDYQVGLRK